MKYSLKCTCGHVTTVDAANRDEAVAQIKEMMTQGAVESHMAEKHPGEPVPSIEQTQTMIEQNVVEGDLSEPASEEQPVIPV